MRLACATNRDLQAMVDAGRFRRDLFYRINVIHLRLPPLRERRDDILWFAHAFLAEKSPGAPSSSRPTCSRRRAASPRSLHMATRRSGSIFLETLERHGWQIGTSAEALAISRKSLWERMRRLGVAAPEELDVREGDG